MNKFYKQVCIPVGCVLPACYPYLQGCLLLGGGLFPGECLLPEGSLFGGGVFYQGVSAPRGFLLRGVYPSMH